MRKDDCFAFKIRGGLPWCKCLVEIMCAHRKCPFYKSAEQYESELIKIHGTDDLKKIGEQYALKKGGG